jgi:hypothetical protein
MCTAYYSNKRGETVMAGLGMHLVGYIFNRIFTEINLRGVRYFGVVWTQTFGTFSHPLNIAWMSLTCDDSEERALAMAMYVFAFLILRIIAKPVLIQGDHGRQHCWHLRCTDLP